MVHDRLLSVCAQALNVRLETLSDEAGPGTVPGWDSLATMTLLAVIDEEFGVRLPLSVAARIRSIADLRSALRAKGHDDV